MTALLSAKALTVSRGDKLLLRDLSFHASAGELLYLRGPNGIGKSSLIEVLVGLRPPEDGELRRGEIGTFHWVGHRNALSADLTIRENLRAWCALNAASPIGITDAISLLGLRKLANRQVRALSAGQKRRAALARLALVHRALWLLDEPFSALDAEGLAALGALMRAQLERGGAIIVTSHQPLPDGLRPTRTFDLA